jgi:phosphoglycolate phosphatase-like HAD superfamily hydrolase
MPGDPPLGRAGLPYSLPVFDFDGTLRHTVHKLAVALEETGAHLRMRSRGVRR